MVVEAVPAVCLLQLELMVLRAVDQLLPPFQVLVQQDKGMAEDQVLTIPLTMDLAVEADTVLREVTVQPR